MHRINRMISNSILRSEINKCINRPPFCMLLAKTLSSEPSTDQGFIKEPLETGSEKGLKDNPYFTKYADKLRKLDPDYIKSKLKGAHEPHQEEDLVTKPSLPPSLSKPKDVNVEKLTHPSSSHTKKRHLNDIVHLDLLKERTPPEITKIWSDFHKNKDCIYSVISSTNYGRIYQKSSKYPLFLYALPKTCKTDDGEKTGFEFFVGQFSGHQIHFTNLAFYQRFKENSPVCMSIFHYPELEQEKGIVLMSGEMNKDVLTVMEAQCLANQINLYYSSENVKRDMMLYTFNKAPEHFNHMDLIRELQDSLSFA